MAVYDESLEDSYSVYDTLGLLEVLIDGYSLYDKRNLSIRTHIYDTQFITPFGTDRLDYYVYTLLSDNISLYDDINYEALFPNKIIDVLEGFTSSVSELRILISRKDLLEFKDKLKPILFIRASSPGILFSESLGLLFPNSILDTLSFHDKLSLFLRLLLIDTFPGLSDEIGISFVFINKDIFSLYDEIGASLSTTLTLKDLLSFLDVIVLFGKPDAKLFFALIPSADRERGVFYSLYSTSIQITGADGIVTAEDGIYSFSEEKTTGELIFRFGSLSSSRLKRLDKIFSSSPLKKATVYTRNSFYTYSGTKWINCGKGLQDNELKVLLENLGDVEFVSFRIAELRRAK